MAVAFCGLKGAGKSMAASIAHDLTGWPVVRTGDYIRNAALGFHKRLNPNCVQATADELRTDGIGILDRILRDFQSREGPIERIIVDSVMEDSDLEALEKYHYRVVLLHLHADETVRLRRVRMRSRPDDPSDLHALRAHDSWEKGLAFQKTHGVKVIPLFNDNTIESLRELVRLNLEELMRDHSRTIHQRI